MNQYPPFFRWLGIAALLDWLVTRTLTRGAIFMPKPAAAIAVYEGFGQLGQVASTAAALLALVAMCWVGWREIKTRQAWDTGLALFILAALSVWGLFQAATGWQAVTFQLLYIFCLLAFVLRGWSSTAGKAQKSALLLVAATLLSSHLFQLAAAVNQALAGEGLPVLTQALFNLGELLALGSIAALWWAFGRGAGWKTWLVSASVAFLFLAPRLLNPAMTGILAIWSTGLSLYLPWPLYALALLLAGVTAITCLRSGNPAGWALLLLAAGGYAPQLSYQAFLGLVALWLLADSGRPVRTPILSTNRLLELGQKHRIKASL